MMFLLSLLGAWDIAVGGESEKTEVTEVSEGQEKA